MTASAASIINAAWLPSIVPVTTSPGSCAWAAATMELTIDVPTAPPSCWVVLITALPSAFSSALSWRRPLVAHRTALTKGKKEINNQKHSSTQLQGKGTETHRRKQNCQVSY